MELALGIGSVKLKDRTKAHDKINAPFDHSHARFENF